LTDGQVIQLITTALNDKVDYVNRSSAEKMALSDLIEERTNKNEQVLLKKKLVRNEMSFRELFWYTREFEGLKLSAINTYEVRHGT
jgi:hypothetical protein